MKTLAATAFRLIGIIWVLPAYFLVALFVVIPGYVVVMFHALVMGCDEEYSERVFNRYSNQSERFVFWPFHAANKMQGRYYVHEW